MTGQASSRGQPLVALSLIVGGWIAMRVAFLEMTSFRSAEPTPPVLIAATPAKTPVPAAQPQPPFAAAAVAPAEEPARLLPEPAAPLPPATRFTPMPEARPAPLSPSVPQSAVPSVLPLAPPPSPPVPARITAAHQMLWMAALANLPLPQGIGQKQSAPQPARPPAQLRWSADGWLLLRRGDGVASAAGIAPATYGASQLGAVVRYRLAPESPHRPALYLRGSAALAGTREREAAFGASARPIAGLPVVVAAEARVNAQPGRTRVRPAAFAYTEIAPVALPLGTRAEVYGQTGYVGGDFATAFVDGQLKVDRRVTALAGGELRAGGGAWGGAQKGASRLDVGPSATLGLPLGRTSGARLALDWRFRVIGNAAPASGPALTLSAGF